LLLTAVALTKLPVVPVVVGHKILWQWYTLINTAIIDYALELYY
jgi:hypothetical protein